MAGFFTVMRSGFLIGACLLAAGCAAAPVQSIDDYRTELADVLSYPQDLTVYAVPEGNGRLLSADVQATYNKRFDELWFGPWDGNLPGPGDAGSSAVVPAYWAKGRAAAGYAGNLRRWTAEAKRRILDRAQADKYPSMSVPAITVTPAYLRALPGEQPLLSHPFLPGRGWPFDGFQYTALPAGMPVLVTHASSDKAWLFVESHVTGGWIPAQNIAVAGKEFQNSFRSGRYAACIRDGVALHDESGCFLSMANVGTTLPQDTEGRVLVPVRDADGMAQIRYARVSSRDMPVRPVPLTAEAVARIGNEFMGQPYGWGGMNGGRDCSALIRDLFTPFGIWLPRNSANQRRAWTQISLKDMSDDERLETILRRGKPFATLVNMPGHVMLYVGSKNGIPLVFHSLWAVRTSGDGNIAGRLVVGKAVVTSLSPGEEIDRVPRNALLLRRINSITVLTE